MEENKKKTPGCLLFLGVLFLIGIITFTALSILPLIRERMTKKAISPNDLVTFEGNYTEQVESYVAGKTTWPSLTISSFDPKAGSFVINYVTQKNDKEMNPTESVEGTFYCEINEVLDSSSINAHFRAVGEDNKSSVVWGSGTLSIVNGVPTIQLMIKQSSPDDALPLASATFQKAA
ncbi:hypothetical protein [Olsenella intestinalis]|uniref:hypothetical protein n=1 Tax=Olsenella intestinalis TaxID=2930083 RepID=UPI00200FA133|nr:hypothetical protein [Olsenella intestinalis]